MDNLINSGKLLLDESNFAKPKMKIWQIQCRRMLASLYDDEIAKEFSKALDRGAVIFGDNATVNNITAKEVLSAASVVFSVRLSAGRILSRQQIGATIIPRGHYYCTRD